MDRSLIGASGTVDLKEIEYRDFWPQGFDCIVARTVNEIGALRNMQQPFFTLGYALFPVLNRRKQPRDTGWQERAYRQGELKQWVVQGGNLGIDLCRPGKPCPATRPARTLTCSAAGGRRRSPIWQCCNVCAVSKATAQLCTAFALPSPHGLVSRRITRLRSLKRRSPTRKATRSSRPMQGRHSSTGAAPSCRSGRRSVWWMRIRWGRRAV